MKFALPLLAIALLAAVGCQDSKSTSMSPPNSSVTDVAMTPAPVTTSTPPVFEPAPVQPAATVTPAMSTTPVPATAGTTYKIQPGDTLWKLATQHYGNGNQWKKIADANPGLTPSSLKVGQTITIP